MYTLALEAGHTQSTLASVLQRNTAPKIDTLQCLCEAFGITLAQFFAIDEKSELLSDKEREMLAQFRTLSEQKQDALIEFIKLR